MSGTRTAPRADRGGRGARERILTAATTLFHREGIHATGVERLTEHAHVSKRTFYQHFSSKNDLVEGDLRRIHHAGGMPSEHAIDTADASPRAPTNATSPLLHARSAAETLIDAATIDSGK